MSTYRTHLPKTARLPRFSSLTFIFLTGLVLILTSAETPAQPRLVDLTVTKSGDETARVGGTITYSIVVTNGGPDTATNVVMSDALPPNTTLVSATATFGGIVLVDNTTVTVTFASITAFESAGATVVVSVNSDTPQGNITNSVTARSDAPDPQLNDNTATWLTVITGPFAGEVLISEFRLRGSGGATDEYIEIYNNADTPHAVQATDGSAGYAVAASDGVIRCVIPNRTILPARGHFLCVNSDGYSLGLYPAGESSTATGDITYTTDIPDNAGLAIFRVANPQNFTLFNRFDAVGSSSETDALYKEGTGYSALSPLNLDYAFYRDNCGKSGSVTTGGNCPSGGLPKDTDNNAADFVFVSPVGDNLGAGARLGAPGPENLSGPTQRNESLGVSILDPCVSASSPPNRVRDLTSDPANNSPFGTLDIRRTVTNVTEQNVTRLRWRIIDITTFPTPNGIADLRARTSPAVVVTVDRPPCGSATSNVTVQGTTLESPPLQPSGGGYNSTLSSGTVTLDTPLLFGESLDLRFLLGVQKTGTFRFFINIEALSREPDIPPDQDVNRGGTSRIGSLVRKSRGVSTTSSTTPGAIASIDTTTTTVSARKVNVSNVVLVVTGEERKVTRKTKKTKAKKVSVRRVKARA